jgi:hypothetical protein
MNKRDSRAQHKLQGICIFLVIAALVIAITGCTGIYYTLTLSSTEGGRVTAPGEGVFTYPFCTEVSLVATPNYGYRFVNWTGDVRDVVDVNSASTIITSMQGDWVIRANFEPIPAGKFSLTASSGAGGSVTSPGEGSFLYDAGTVVNLVAAADSGYKFVNWTGDVGTIANVNLPATTITMEGNYVIKANFEPIPAGKFSLTASSSAGGSVTAPGEGVFLYDAGTVVNLVAAADSGYKFVNWTGDVGTIGQCQPSCHHYHHGRQLCDQGQLRADPGGQVQPDGLEQRGRLGDGSGGGCVPVRCGDGGQPGGGSR